jgi:hypothetical protein
MSASGSSQRCCQTRIPAKPSQSRAASGRSYSVPVRSLLEYFPSHILHLLWFPVIIFCYSRFLPEFSNSGMTSSIFSLRLVFCSRNTEYRYFIPSLPLSRDVDALVLLSSPLRDEETASIPTKEYLQGMAPYRPKDRTEIRQTCIRRKVLPLESRAHINFLFKCTLAMVHSPKSSIRLPTKLHDRIPECMTSSGARSHEQD